MLFDGTTLCKILADIGAVAASANGVPVIDVESCDRQWVAYAKNLDRRQD